MEASIGRLYGKSRLNVLRPTAFLKGGYEKAKTSATTSYRKARSARIEGLVTIGGGALLAVGGGVAYLVGKGAYSSYEAATTQAAADSSRATAELWQNLFWGGVIGGGAAISVGSLIEFGTPKTEPFKAIIDDLDKKIADLSDNGVSQ